VDRRADVETFNRGFDEVRDRIGRNRELNRVLDDLDRAAALHARALLLADHVHRNHDLDGLALGNAQEVDVDWEVAYRIELVVARNDANGLAVDVDLEDRGQEVAGEDQLLGLIEVEGNRLGRLTGTVDNSWNLALATNSTGGPLAAPVARHGLDLLDFAHRRGP
jgi:hypothetical protein